MKCDDGQGWKLEPVKKLNGSLINLILKTIRHHESTSKVCVGIVNPYVICGKVLAKQAKGCYCTKHRHQSEIQKQRVKRSKQNRRLKKC